MNRSFSLLHNSLGLCEMTENRDGKFRLRLHIVKANFFLVNYPKKANEIGIAEYEAENFKLQITPPFCHYNFGLNLQ